MTAYTRETALLVASVELECLVEHVATLDSITLQGALPEWRPGIEQLRAAVERVRTDLQAFRASRLQ